MSTPNQKKHQVQSSHYRIRALLGWLGVLLPFILLAGNALILNLKGDTTNPLLNSISHYHYSYMGLVFTGVLMAFSLLLISYKGYPEKDVFFSDNVITNLAGFFALIAVLIPTEFIYGAGLMETPNLHTNPLLRNMHLGSAGLFLFLLGALSFFKFSQSHANKSLYQFCGIMVWLPILVLAIAIPLGWAKDNSLVFWMEVVSLFFFGFSWLLKGRNQVLYMVGLVDEEEWKEKVGELGVE